MNLLRHCLNELIPQECLLCSSQTTNDSSRNFLSTETTPVICSICEPSLPKTDISCSKCSTPLNSNSHTELCGQCISQERYWHHCIAPFIYRDSITKLIHQFKYQNDQTLKKYFAHAIIDYIQENDELKNEKLITHVPMHPKRFFERGYNQSLGLALTISTLTNIPHKNLLIKNQITPSQVTLSKKDRQIQLKNSFNVKDNQEYSIENKHIILVDDVVTTGATSTELAKTLKRFGAKQVDIWCIART